jgi:hypothetical protein
MSFGQLLNVFHAELVERIGWDETERALLGAPSPVGGDDEEERKAKAKANRESIAALQGAFSLSS